MQDVDYAGLVDDALDRLKAEGRYRFFAELERVAGTAKATLREADGTTKNVTIWCSNDYLAMAQHRDPGTEAWFPANALVSALVVIGLVQALIAALALRRA